MKKAIAMLLATVMSTAMLTGCGSDSTTKESTQATESSVAETAAATTEAAATEAADKTEGGVLVFGTNAEFPPFEYVGDDGEPDGFDVALIKAVGEKLGMEVQVENMEFDSLVSSIGNRIDGAIAGMTVTDERKEQVDFSDPYYEAVQFVIVPADSDIATADDLKNKTIGSQLGTTGMFLSEDIEGVTAQTYNRAIDAVNDLVNGRVDAVIIDKNPAEVFNTKFEGKVKIIDGAEFGFETEEYAIALPKGSELVEQVNQALADLKADGTFDTLVSEYIGE
ncbi:basic amino acid ABC transporter substrate-binding protein [Simiaoa sp.]|uniref:basic amino acid ABC transporter substrate-binding protein n=1 Tax=Simiaoa sp. TaxID=2944202 RepID=UPI003F7CD83C